MQQHSTLHGGNRFQEHTCFGDKVWFVRVLNDVYFEAVLLFGVAVPVWQERQKVHGQDQ